MTSRLLAALFLCAFTSLARAQEDPSHNELRALRDGLIAGMNSGNIEGQIGFLHPNVVITWHNAEVSRGHDGVRNYLDRMLKGPSKKVDEFSATVNVDELSTLYGGDTAIAFGSAEEHFKLTSGRHFDLKGRWTATMVKEDGKWLVASLHTSDNIFDNPLLNAATGAMVWAACATFIVGLAAGWFMTRLGRKA